MHLLFFWLRKLAGVLLVAAGLLVGVIGICGTFVFASQWYKGESLTSDEHQGWLACVVAGIVGGLLLWAGAVLKASDARPKHGGTFRLHLTGQQRRRSANAAIRDTLIWLFVAAEVCFIFLHGHAALRFRHALEGVVVIYFGLHAVILVHELGHLGIAALLRFDLQKLQVGTGPVLCKARLGGLQLEWRALLGGGLVLTADERERGWRWRHWLYVAGGPAATAGGCILLAGWIEQRHPSGGWFGGTNGLADVVGMYLCAYSAMFFLITLLPSWARVGTVRARTDGHQLLHTPRFTAEKVRYLIIATSMRRVEMLWEDGKREAAWERIRAILIRYPAEPLLSVTEGHYFAEQGDYVAAAASYQRSLQMERLPEPAREQLMARRFSALARANETEGARQYCADALREVASARRVARLDAFATEVLQHELRAFLPDADAWSQEALALDPAKITLQGNQLQNWRPVQG